MITIYICTGYLGTPAHPLVARSTWRLRILVFNERLSSYCTQVLRCSMASDAIRALFYFLRPFFPLPFALPAPVPPPPPLLAPSARTFALLSLNASPPSSLTV